MVACRNFESRVPHPTILVVRLVKIYVEINPFALRRNFELLVMLDVSKIRANKYFGHVPIPQLVRFVLRIRVRLHRELLVRADKQEIQVLARPSGAYFRPISGNSLALRIALHVHGPRPAPELRGWIRVENDVFFRPCALNDPVSRKCQTREHEHKTDELKTAIHPNAPVRTHRLLNADMTGRLDRFLRSGREKGLHADRGTTAPAATLDAVGFRESRECNRENCGQGQTALRSHPLVAAPVSTVREGLNLSGASPVQADKPPS